MMLIEETLQYQLEEERKRYTQLLNDKKSLEIQVKEMAVKLSGIMETILL